MTGQTQRSSTAGKVDGPPKRRPWITLLLVLAFGVTLAWGGAKLLLLGGTPYYVLAGLALVAVAVLLFRQRREAIWLYGAILVATAGWAVWESGADVWALLPRLAAPVAGGLWLLTPWVRRALAPARGRTGQVMLAASALLGIGLGIAGLMRTPAADPMFDTAAEAMPGGVPLAALPEDGDWKNYGNDPGGARFSTAGQLTPANVDDLEVAWTYRLGPAPEGYVTFEATPLKVRDTVYICTGYNDVIAIDAETGRERWRFRAKVDIRDVASMTCRGVAWYSAPDATVCPERILANTLDARLIALDARTGQRCADFGKNGEVSLLTGMGQVTRGYYYATSAPTVVRGKVVLGGWVTDGQYWGEPSGVIRAFDARTGALAWAFDMGRPDRTGEPGPGEEYTRATPNSWAPMSADEELGLVYAPTGNATPDYFGAQRRPFDEAYTSAVVALDAETGRPRWAFRTAYHDVWDYDVGSQPTLLDLPGANGPVRALAQATKRGELFLLDRVTGKPLAKVEDRPVPQSGAVPEERLSAVQPFSVGMPSFRGKDLTEATMWGLTPVDQLWCRLRFREARYEGPMTPPGLTPSITSPGYLGGMDWGGVAIDRDRNLLVVNTNHVANYTRLLTREEANRRRLKPRRPGSKEYVGGPVPQANTPYGAETGPFLSPLGVPCQQPPFGRLTAIDLVTRKVVWTKPLGTARDSGPLDIKSGLPLTMGVPNLGGSIVTRGGLTFIGATQDRYLRAFETTSGRLLWEARLPAGAQSTPSSYVSPASGRQMVVVAAGGSGLMKSKPGDYLIAYALPKRGKARD